MDLKSLNYEQFEVLVAKLLQAEGYEIKKANKYQVSGPDIVLRSKDGKTSLVEVKHFVRQDVLPSSLVRQIHSDLDKYSKLESADNFILVTSNSITDRACEEIKGFKNTRFIDRSAIKKLLDRHQNITKEFEALIECQGSVLDIDISIQVTPDENSLITKLRNTPLGKDGWREYEDICVKILNYLFLSPLSPPKVQSRTEDGLDIRDAIYAIRPGNQYWDMLRSECSTRFMVAEFKNYKDPIGQQEVESIRQYLYPKARRSFGVLCSRKGHNGSAEKKRRRSWVEDDKLIAFVTDSDLIEMINLKDSGEEPFQVIDSHLEEFFSILCP